MIHFSTTVETTDDFPFYSDKSQEKLSLSLLFIRLSLRKSQNYGKVTIIRASITVKECDESEIFIKLELKKP